MPLCCCENGGNTNDVAANEALVVRRRGEGGEKAEVELSDKMIDRRPDGGENAEVELSERITLCGENAGSIRSVEGVGSDVVGRSLKRNLEESSIEKTKKQNKPNSRYAHLLNVSRITFSMRLSCAVVGGVSSPRIEGRSSAPRAECDAVDEEGRVPVRESVRDGNVPDRSRGTVGSPGALKRAPKMT